MKRLQNKSVCQTVIAPVTLCRPNAAAAAAVDGEGDGEGVEDAATRSGYIVYTPILGKRSIIGNDYTLRKMYLVFAEQ